MKAGTGMGDRDSTWSIWSVLIGVSDVDHSSAFYQDVMSVHEVFREGEMVILGPDQAGSFTLALRQEYGAHPGQHTLGLRSLTCDVGSAPELDRVEQRLRALDAFRDRQSRDETTSIEVVYGLDPDRLPLTFLAHKPGSVLSEGTYRRALPMFYAVDL